MEYLFRLSGIPQTCSSVFFWEMGTFLEIEWFLSKNVLEYFLKFIHFYFLFKIITYIASIEGNDRSCLFYKIIYSYNLLYARTDSRNRR